MKKLIYIILLSIIITSCEKEIDFQYRSIDKLYVIEGLLSNETIKVAITKTQDMGNVVGVNEFIDGVVVSILSDDGNFETLQYEDGYYISPSGFTGEVGKSYTLSVSIDDDVFVSQSTMNKQTQIDSIHFRWMNILGERLLICVLEIPDIPEEENYYCYYMYRNGERYRWSLLSDKGSENTVIKEYITCMLENGEMHEEDTLKDGDEITIEVRTIDRRTFDYLYSLMLSNRTSSNPLKNFSGECLGYFSAHSVVRKSTIFYFNDINQ